MTERVQVEIKAPVATLTLNKPERLNADILSEDQREGRHAAAERKRADFKGR